MNRLNEIEARANAATEGPWAASSGYVESGTATIVECSDPLPFDQVNAEFIAHARTDVPEMAAALRAVLAIHTPVDRGRATACCTCEQWIESTDPEACIEWPCTTVEAIRQHIGDDL